MGKNQNLRKINKYQRLEMPSSSEMMLFVLLTVIYPVVLSIPLVIVEPVLHLSNEGFFAIVFAMSAVGFTCALIMDIRTRQKFLKQKQNHW
jgi:hypothetical protein